MLRRLLIPAALAIATAVIIVTFPSTGDRIVYICPWGCELPQWGDAVKEIRVYGFDGSLIAVGQNITYIPPGWAEVILDTRPRKTYVDVYELMNYTWTGRIVRNVYGYIAGVYADVPWHEYVPYSPAHGRLTEEVIELEPFTPLREGLYVSPRPVAIGHGVVVGRAYGKVWRIQWSDYTWSDLPKPDPSINPCNGWTVKVGESYPTSAQGARFYVYYRRIDARELSPSEVANALSNWQYTCPDGVWRYSGRTDVRGAWEIDIEAWLYVEPAGVGVYQVGKTTAGAYAEIRAPFQREGGYATTYLTYAVGSDITWYPTTTYRLFTAKPVPRLFKENVDIVDVDWPPFNVTIVRYHNDYLREYAKLYTVTCTFYSYGYIAGDAPIADLVTWSNSYYPDKVYVRCELS